MLKVMKKIKGPSLSLLNSVSTERKAVLNLDSGFQLDSAGKHRLTLID